MSMRRSPGGLPSHRGLLLVVFLLFALAAFAAAQTQQPSSPSTNSQTPMPADEPSPAQAQPAQSGQPAPAAESQSTPERAVRPTGHNEVLIKGGTLLMVTHGRVENGEIYIKD